MVLLSTGDNPTTTTTTTTTHCFQPKTHLTAQYCGKSLNNADKMPKKPLRPQDLHRPLKWIIAKSLWRQTGRTYKVTNHVATAHSKVTDKTCYYDKHTYVLMQQTCFRCCVWTEIGKLINGTYFVFQMYILKSVSMCSIPSAHWHIHFVHFIRF